MSNPIYSARPTETVESDVLAELALNLRWSFNHEADVIWERLDPALWALTHNPWFVLQTVSRERLEAVTGDPEFQQLVDDVVQEKRRIHESPAWLQQTHPDAALTTVAYFSMEFMLTEALAIYAGGLGNVAGDQLKTASNLGVPIVGIGLLYQLGYFRQELDPRGRQLARYPFNDPGQLPIRPLRGADGEWLRFAIAFPGSELWIRAWQVDIGRVRLYLLDTNDPANAPAHRGITGELYGGDADVRLKQEIVLGVGGWRLLRTIGLRPEICHLNEGHAAFAVLERVRNHMIDHHRPFDLALTITRPGNLFTTHTPVESGFDRFRPEHLARFFASYAAYDLGIAFDDLLALGRRNRDDASEWFNMAYLAIRGSGAVNGVSRLHGAVSRRIFQPLFPRWPTSEVPITHVTNGVHMPTWDSAEADRIWESACGKNRWHGSIENVEQAFDVVRDLDLWRLRDAGRRALVTYVRERLARQMAEQGASADEIEQARSTFDPEALTLGFARRFATYKRPNLLLHDPDRLARLLANPERPGQLIVAGKAHPDDPAGQALLREWAAFVQRPDVRGRAVFLSDYDMLMAERLVQGIDLWINTPRRPWEACGTSGMKVLVNGGLHISELDGWWAEAYSPEAGWAIGDGRDRGEDPAWDATEAGALYDLLEREIFPAFYTRDGCGIPPGWVTRMRHSMTRLTPEFSASRSVRQYTEDHYLPGAAAYRARAEGDGKIGAELLSWQAELERGWSSARFGDLQVATHPHQHEFRVALYLGDLHPDHVHVELYADGTDGAEPVRFTMTPVPPSGSSGDGNLYATTVPASRPASDYTPRLVPYHPLASVPLEAPFILWYEPRS